MNYDPISQVSNESLEVTPEVLNELSAFRVAEKFVLLPGVNTTDEKECLSLLLNELLDRVITNVAKQPTKLWVMKQFQSTLLQLEVHDTEAREHFGMELEHLMDILGIESSDGLLSCYLGGL